MTGDRICGHIDFRYYYKGAYSLDFTLLYFYMPFWQTAVGSTTMMVDGNLIQGGPEHFLLAASAGCDSFQHQMPPGIFPGVSLSSMIFDLPGAALAMYLPAVRQNRKERPQEDFSVGSPGQLLC